MHARWTAAFRFIASAIGLTATACTLTVGENHFFYPGPANTPPPHVIEGATVEDVSLVASDGTPLGGIRIRRPDADLEVLYFGGNASHADDMAAVLGSLIAGPQVNVTMVDYRGYGRSSGKPTIDALKSDALSVFDYVRAHADDKPIVVHGVSLGGFVASHVAANRTAQGLVLESTAPDVETWAHNQIPFYARPILRIHIAPALLAQSNVEAVKRYSGPLLLIAGSRDAVTPPRFLERLLAKSASPVKRMIIAQGADHGFALGVPEARAAYEQFLDVVRSGAR